MDNTNSDSFDWLAVQDQSSNKSFSDLQAAGIDPTLTTLQPKSFYQQSPKIQSEFRTQTGDFDQKSFDKYYSSAQQSLNQFKKSNLNLGNVTTDLWDNTPVSRAMGAPIAGKSEPVKISLTSSDPFTAMKTAQGSFMGLTELNKWSDPTKSVAQVAKTQNVVDSLSGKDLGYTPEDNGISDLFGFGSEPLVQAQYDKDDIDSKGNVLHKKGESKLNKAGLPYYETLAGRDLAGKQQLSRWNTLFKSDSPLDKFNFMSDDDLKKSTTGIAVKTIAELAPFLVGGAVSAAYKVYTIATGLLDATSEISKSIDGILNNDASGNFYKWANTLQGYVGQAKTGMSQEGKDNFFGLESLLTQGADTVNMLMSQEALAKWPSEVKKYQMAKELGLAEGSTMKAFSMSADASKDLDVQLLTKVDAYLKNGNSMEQAAAMLAKNADQLANYQKYSSYFSTAYMAATSAVGISQAADAAGLDPRDKGMLYFGYLGAMVPLFRSNMGRWVEHNLNVDQIAADQNKSLVDYAAKYTDTIGQSLDQFTDSGNTSGKGLKSLFVGKKWGEAIAEKYKNLTVMSKLPVVAIAEGSVMFTQEALKNGLEAVYNGLSSHGITSTDNAKFDLDPSEVAKDLAVGAFGGALGGVLFKGIDMKLNPDNHLPPVSRDMMDWVTQGYGDTLVKNIQTMKAAGQVADTTMSMTPLTDTDGKEVKGMYKPIDAENPVSQNDAIADHMVKQVRIVETLRRAFGINHPDATIEAKNAFYQALVDTRTDTDLPDQIRNNARDIYSLSKDIALAESDETLTGESESLKQKRLDLTMLKNKLEYLQGDESLDEFFRQGLFNISTDLNHVFGVKTRNDFIAQVNPSLTKYGELSGDEKDKVNTLFQNYRALDGPGGLKEDLKASRESYEHFDQNMESKGHYGRLEEYKQSLLELKTYADAGKFIYPTESPIAEYEGYRLMNDYINKLSGIKYIPDAIFDEIGEHLSTFASKNAVSFLSQLAPSVDDLKSEVYSNIGTTKMLLNDDNLKGYLEKRFTRKGMEDFSNSAELKDIVNNKSEASDYSLLHVLKRVGSAQDDPKIAELQALREILHRNSPDEALSILTGIDHLDGSTLEPDDAKLIQHLQKAGLGKFLEKSETLGMGVDELMDNVGPKELIGNFLALNHMGIIDPENVHPSVIMTASDPRMSKDLMLNLLLYGEHYTGSNTLFLSHIRGLDTTELDNAVGHAKDFDENKRVASPLREALEKEYQWIDDEFKTFDKVGGYENYLNSSEAFQESIDSVGKAIARVDSLVQFAATLNPIVNDFRKNYGSTLETTKKGEVLFEISPEDTTYLSDEIRKLKLRLGFLDDVNTFNKNNLLNRLLKEKGLDLVSKYTTLKDVAGNPEVLKLIPTFQNLFSLDNIIEYTNGYRTASQELKRTALHDMVQFEDSINSDFQKLSDEDKYTVINNSFLPVDTSSKEFYADTDAEHGYNPSLRTLYLAKLYGTSSTDFYTRYAGKFDDATQLYNNIEKLPHTPFHNQEQAIRMTHLLLYGDQLVIRSLFNAYTKNPDDKGATYRTADEDSLDSTGTMNVHGRPGSGKTTAFLTNSINLTDDLSGNVLLLGPKQRHVDTLVSTLTNSGFEHRIDKGNSKIFREFMKSLALTDKKGVVYDFDSNDPLVDEIDDPNARVSRANFMKELDRIMTKRLDLIESKTDSGYTLKDSVANAIGKYKIIATDEYTYLNPFDLAMLSQLVDMYNGSIDVQNDASKRVALLNLGDPTQSGYNNTQGLRRDLSALANVLTTAPLGTPLRSGLDLVNNVGIDIGNRTIALSFLYDDQLASTDVITNSKQKPLKLTYAETPEGNVGVKSVTKSGPTTLDDLSFITNNRNLLKGEGGKRDIVYITTPENTSSAEALMQSALGSNWRNFVDIYTPTEVAGGEYKYAIVDASPTYSNTPNDIKRAHEFLNTMLTRATQGTLLLTDNTLNRYFTLENVKKEKAINQIKIDDSVRADLKSEQQLLMRVILQNADPSTDATSKEQQIAMPSDKQEQIVAIPSVDYADNMPIFQPQPDEVQRTGPRSGDVISYNSFMTAEDQSNIFKLMFPTALPHELDSKSADVAMLINSYKHYLLHRDEYGDQNISLRIKFMNHFMDEYGNQLYDYENPVFNVEVTKRGENNMMVGRTQIGSTAKQSPNDVLALLKVTLPRMEGAASNGNNTPLTLTMGALNDVERLASKPVDVNDKSGQLLRKFFSDVKSHVLDNKPIPVANGKPVGESFRRDGSNVWRSPEMTSEHFNEMVTIFNSRLQDLDTKVNLSFDEFRKQFPDFMITAPQVVVANMKDENNTPIFDPDGKNADYRRVWEQLKGKAVAFVSDVYELRGLNADDLLNIYVKQLSYFNDPSTGFSQMDNAGKERYIKDLALNQGAVIKLPNGQEIGYKPFMVKLIKLDNPTNTFLDFRQRFIAAVESKKERLGVDAKFTQADLEQFNTSIYVKDRLIKSLMVIRQFLNDPRQSKWFEANVLIKQHADSQARMDELHDEMIEVMGRDFADNAKLGPLALEKSGPLTLDQFRAKLDELLSPESNILRSKYLTYEGTNIKRSRTTTEMVKPEDLTLQLTNNKQADFMGSLIDIRMFNLLKLTKNVNFAELIDQSLREFSGFPSDKGAAKRFSKYDLSGVFKGGMIENVVLASKQENVNYLSNVLAEVVNDRDFTLNRAKLTHPSYNIPFDQLLAEWSNLDQSRVPASTVQTPEEVQLTDAERVSSLKDQASSLQGTTLYKEAFNGTKTPDEIIKLLSEGYTHIETHNKPLTLDTTIGYNITDGTIDSEDGIHTVRDEMNGAWSRIDHKPTDAVPTAVVTASSNNSITVRATIEGNTYEMTYNSDSDTVKVTPIKVDDATNHVEVMQNISKEEMKNYSSFIKEKVGDAIEDPTFKVMLDMYERLFKHAMLTANIVSSGSDATIGEVDPEMADFDLDKAQSVITDYMIANKLALRSTRDARELIDNYISNYTPNNC